MPGWGADYDDDGYQKRLEGYAKSFINLRGFWPKVVPLFIRWEGKQFASEGVYWTGAPWAPLSPRYAAWKAIHFPGQTILKAKGDLLRGATTPKRVVTAQTLTLIIEWPKKPEQPRPWKRDPTKMTHPTQVFDPAWHHLGEGNNPMRPLLMEEFLNPEQQMELDEAANDYAEEMARLWRL